jgi:hypothetical protein
MTAGVVIAAATPASPSTRLRSSTKTPEPSPSVAAPMSTARSGHAAALTYDGYVVLAGGFNGGRSLQLTSSIRYLETVTTSQAALATPRAGLTATTLLNGNILVLSAARAPPASSRPQNSTIRFKTQLRRRRTP